jgi:hypothetical protein
VYENKKRPPLPRTQFLLRVAAHLAVVVALTLVSLAIGIAGYMNFEHLSALDAFVDAAMLLGGMGPVHIPVTTAGKLFAGLYALYAGLVFLLGAGVLFAPLLHRVIHKFHWDNTH